MGGHVLIGRITHHIQANLENLLWARIFFGRRAYFSRDDLPQRIKVVHHNAKRPARDGALAFAVTTT
jgi:hypothetical protein